jgi:DNA-binding FadR family transcriptional regulator
VDSIRRPPSISGEVGAYLERMIAGLEPGARLPTERELAESLSVSRTSVREALHSLERRRLVDRRPGRGTVVLAPDLRAQRLSDELDPQVRERADVAELRRLIEPQVAGLAAARATETDIVLLERTLAASHAGLSPEESLERDLEFHAQLAHASGNPLLTSLCEVVAGWSNDLRRRSHTTRAGRRSSVRWHRTILDAVTAHDADAAAAAMTEHLADVARLVEPDVEERP